MKRRAFFKRFAAIGLALALAPEIAFHRPLAFQFEQEKSEWLEFLPWEDHLQNILTQMLLTAKANLHLITEIPEL